MVDWKLPGSDSDIHELMENLSLLRDVRKKGLIEKEKLDEAIEKAIREFLK